MKTFDPPLKAGDRVRTIPAQREPIELIVSVLTPFVAWARINDRSEMSLAPDDEGKKWERVTPLAPGDEVVIIERRSGIVTSVSDETALVETSWVEINPLRTERVPIELSAEGRDWERAK